MRTSLVNTLSELMSRDKKIFVLTADMGYSVFEGLMQKFPTRFKNTGVTEQSSIGIAAGLALSGYKVFFYAQAVFATMRCFEQFRLDIAYQNLNVKVIGTAAGFTLNQLGVSHFALEDIGLVRMMPNVTIFTPGDAVEARWVTLKASEIEGPVYIRLTKDTPQIHQNSLKIQADGAIKISDGTDVSILTNGSTLGLAVKVAAMLKMKNISSSVVSFPVIRPINEKIILNELKKTGFIVTLEEHFIDGGFGSMVAELIFMKNLNPKFLKFGIDPEYPKITGSSQYLLDRYGLSADHITNRILKLLL